MATPTVRMTAHTYPEEELDAMYNFYGNKRCVISRMLGSVEWSYTLDAALESCNTRLAEMLARKLRQDRHPKHAAEVQENIVPFESNHHRAMDEQLPRMTLFPHEDILARTLAYEQDLRQWRIAELGAGRGDPGRPTYEEAFVGTLNSITQHRCHAAYRFGPFIRNEGNDLVQDPQIYYHVDCPGIDNPTSRKHFPIIDTLLSIPFSLLHNLPRLAGIEQQLITMGAGIIMLWWWDPSPNMIEKSEKIRLQNNALNQHNTIRNPKPDPIHHQSRRDTTFSTKQPMITYGTPTTHSSSHDPSQDVDSFELPSGQVLLGTTPFASWDEGGLLLPPRGERLVGIGGVQHADKDIITGAISLPAICEAWDVQTIMGTEDSDDINAIKDVEEKPPTHPAPLDIPSWYEKVAESTPEPLPLIHGPFERGVIGGLSVNDILMIKGLIDPPVYIQFLDLSLFSHSHL